MLPLCQRGVLKAGQKKLAIRGCRRQLACQVGRASSIRISSSGSARMEAERRTEKRRLEEARALGQRPVGIFGEWYALTFMPAVIARSA
jgi:hypothetical protein